MFRGTTTGDVATWTKNMGGVALNNYLINLGETSDISNLFFKPTIAGADLYDERNIDGSYNPMYGQYVAIMNDELEGDAYKDQWLAKLDRALNTGGQGYEVRDLAGLIALKATWGAYGTTPSFEYDQSMYENGKEMGFWQSMLLTLPCEILFDPGTFISFGGKAATESVLASSTNEVLDGVRDVYRAAGFTDEVIQSLNDDIAKQVAKAIDSDVTTILKRAGDTDDTAADAFKHFFTGDSIDDRLANAMKETLTKNSSKTASDLADLARLSDMKAKGFNSIELPSSATRDAIFEAVPKTSRETFTYAQNLTRSNINKSIENVLTNNKAAAGALKLGSSYKIAASLHNAQYRLDKLGDVMRAVALPQFTVVPKLAGLGLKTLRRLYRVEKL